MFKEDIDKHLSKFHAAPFLFIGSGMSRRYIGIETWYDLLQRMHGRLGLSKPFGYYTNNAATEGGTDLPELASLIGAEFNEIWWTSPIFKKSRKAYEKQTRTKYSPLKYEITKYLGETANKVKDEFTAETDLLSKCQVSGIITTNWDSLLESIFVDFKSYVGQEQLIFSEVMSIGEIYKIHGSVEDPESLLLTKEDYDVFHERNPYLASKLLNIFMEHPIIFMGYSLEDPNIQQILKAIIKILKKENIDKLKDRLIFCKWSREKLEPTMSDNILMIGDTVLPIKMITLYDYSDILNPLTEIKRKIPVKVLRHMKNLVYEYVKDTEKKSTFYVAGDLEKLAEMKNGEFVYGVGITAQLQAKGVKGIDTRDLIRDIVFDAKLPSVEICKLILAPAGKAYIPYFKHLLQAGYLDNNGQVSLREDVPEFTRQFIDKVNSIGLESFLPAKNYVNRRSEINKTFSSVQDVWTNEKDSYRQLMILPLISVDKVDLEQLRAFLKANIDLIVSSNLGTHFRKLVCLYDFLKYKYPLTKAEMKKGPAKKSTQK